MNRLAKIVLSIVVFVLVLGLLVLGYIAFFTTPDGDDATGPIERIIQFFPFGGGGDPIMPTDRDDPPSGVSTTTPPAAGAISRLRLLSEKPVSGARFVNDSSGSGNYVRYVEQESGNVFDADTRSLLLARITNTTIPRVQEAIFIGEEGENLILRYLSDGSIETFLASVPPSSESSTSTTAVQLSGSFLPKNTSVVETRDSGSIFYINENANTARFIFSSVGEAEAAELTRSNIGEWVADWPSEERLYLTTKASSDSLGYVYKLNQTTGSLEKLMEEELALTTKSNPSGSHLLTSFNENNRPVLGLYDIESKDQLLLSFSTLSEKCTWSPIEEMTVYCGVPETPPIGNYPDLWYQGVSSFSDSLWKINFDSGVGEMLVNPWQEVGVEIDIWNPALAPESDYIIFQNKNDGSLWSYRIIENN
jgi:hypothetical protein